MWLLGARANTKPLIVDMLPELLVQRSSFSRATARREWNDLVVNRMPNISTNFLDEYEREVFLLLNMSQTFSFKILFSTN